MKIIHWCHKCKKDVECYLGPLKPNKNKYKDKVWTCCECKENINFKIVKQ